MSQRLLKTADACRYLGMGRPLFNSYVRPYVTEMPLGSQAIYYDRVDLDNWADEYKANNGRAAKNNGGYIQWDEKQCQVSGSEMKSGTSTKGSKKRRAAGFGSALASLKANIQKQSAC